MADGPSVDCRTGRSRWLPVALTNGRACGSHPPAAGRGSRGVPGTFHVEHPRSGRSWSVAEPSAESTGHIVCGWGHPSLHTSRRVRRRWVRRVMTCSCASPVVAGRDTFCGPGDASIGDGPSRGRSRELRRAGSFHVEHRDGVLGMGRGACGCGRAAALGSAEGRAVPVDESSGMSEVGVPCGADPEVPRGTWSARKAATGFSDRSRERNLSS